MKLTAELQDITHRRIRYLYSATAKQGRHTRCRSFLRPAEDGGWAVRVELTVNGRCSIHTRTVRVDDPAPDALRKLAAHAATNPEQWLLSHQASA